MVLHAYIESTPKIYFMMLPSILNQLGVDSLTSLRRLAEALPKQSVDGKAPLATGEEDDDEVPDLGENFDEASKNEAN